MNEFFKTIKLEFEADKSSIKSVTQDLNILSKYKLFDPQKTDKIVKQLDEFSKKQQVVAKLEKDIATLRNLGTKESNNAAKILQKELSAIQSGDKVKKVLGSGLAKIGNAFLTKMKDVFTSALDRLSDMTKFSKMTDSSVRDLKLGYGFSSSQAYGYTQALDVMGFSSMEDLMYADQQQIDLFRKSFEKYTSYYEETMTPEYVEKQMEYQVAMKEFKLDLEHSVIDFFMENQDTIMGLMDFSMDFFEFVMSALDWIVKALGDDERSQREKDRESASILNSYVTNSKSTKVNMNNTYNGVSKSDQTWLQNSSQMAYKQLVEQLNQG